MTRFTATQLRRAADNAAVNGRPENAAMLRQAADDAEDAERYRWLCDNCRPEYSSIETPHAVVKVCVGDVRNGTGWFDIIGPQAKVGIVTLDQAVDEARKENT